MASVERYLRTFVKVMPQRTKILRSSMRRKKVLDSKLNKSLKFRNQEQIKPIIEELKLLIGKSNWFNSAERRKKQTLRHYLWKFSKSFTFFIGSRDFISKRLVNEPKYATQFLDLLKYSNEDSENLLGPVKSLDKIYIQEVKALEKNDLTSYFELVKKESGLIGSIVQYGANVKQRQGGAIRFIQSYLKKTGKTQEDRDGRKLTIILTLMGILVSSMLYFGVLPSMEADGTVKSSTIEFTKWISLIMAVSPLLFYHVFVGEKNPMHKIIREYVSETV